LLLNVARALPENLTVSFDGASTDSQFVPRDRAPWTHPGKFHLENLTKESLPPDSKGNVALSYTGIARFDGRSGMQVNYVYDGSRVLVTWDKDSKAFLGCRGLEFSASEHTFNDLELTFVFPRPPGKYATPIVMGEKMSKVRVP
jgi:hypothetical protein